MQLRQAHAPDFEERHSRWIVTVAGGDEVVLVEDIDGQLSVLVGVVALMSYAGSAYASRRLCTVGNSLLPIHR